MEADNPANPTEYPIEIMVKMIRNERGAVISVLMGIHNLSRQRQFEQELITHRDQLEKIVKERTAQFEEKNRQLEELNRYFVGRELRMTSLKEEIALLKEKMK